MDALLTMVPWDGLGWGALIFAAVFALIRGDIVPRKTHEAMIASLLDSLRRERQISDKSMDALRLLAVEYGTTTDKLLSSLPVVLEEEGTNERE